MKASAVRVTCSGTDLVKLADLLPFQGELKSLSPEKRAKLKNSILKYGVSFPFFVWRNRGKLFVLDGHQRDTVLKEMQQEGFAIPQVPAVSIKATNEREAKEKILLLSSQYGEMTETSLTDYLKAAGIELADILDTVDLPTVDLDKLAQKILEDGSQEEEPVPEPPADPVSVLGDLWELDRQGRRCLRSVFRKRHNPRRLRTAGPLLLRLRN